MKDVLISGKRLAREGWIFVGCVALALALNTYAIITYKTRWSELVTTALITLVLAAVIYVLFAVVRLIFAGMKRLFRRKTG